MGWLGATMTGQSGLALESARRAAAAVSKASDEETASVQPFLVVPY